MTSTGDQSVSKAFQDLSLTNFPDTYFVHQPLDLSTKALRVIKVHALQADEQISCSMRHTDPPDWDEKLEKTGFRWARQLIEPYTCLSYVWGPTGDERDILLNNKIIQVRKNLYDFLKAVARALAEGKEHPQYELFGSDWWIDALCIDQTNATEKNTLVQRMGNIYSDAYSVVSWYGDEPEMSSYFRRANEWRTLHRAEVHRFSPGVKLLKEHTYWTRAWIVQETHLPQYIRFLAQDVLTDRDALQNLIGERLETAAWSNLHKVLANHFPDSLCTAEINHEGLQDFGTLLETSWRFRDRGCFDRRDLVYSVLSMSTKSTIVAVDYNCTLPQLAKAVLKANGVGVCLCQAYIIFHTLRIDQDPATPDHEVPMIKMQGLRVKMPKKTADLLVCRQCRKCLGLVEDIVTQFELSPEAVFVFCLSCKHNPRNGPKFTKSYGHLIFLPQLPPTSQHHPLPVPTNHLYWVSPTTKAVQEWTEIGGEVKPEYNRKGEMFIQATVATVLELVRRNDQREFVMSVEQLPVVVGKMEKGACDRRPVAKWRIVE